MIKTTGLLAILLVSLSSLLSQQQPYQIKRRPEIGLTLAAGSLSLIGHYLSYRLPALSETQLSMLNPADIPSLDRGTINNWRPATARLSDIVLSASLLSPVLMPLLLPKMRQDRVDLWLMGLQTVLYADVTTTWTKYSVRRVRPYAYLDASADAALYLRQRENDTRYSFFSGHTSGTAVVCYYTASIYQAYYPDSRSRYLVWGTAVLLPALVGYLRVRAGRHFPTDVMAGYLVGASIGILNPWLHRQR